MNYTILWALRFAPMPLLTGFGMMGLAGYSLLIYGPSLDPTAPWVPATFAFGDLPWYGALFIGLLLFLYALRVGANAKRGDPVTHPGNLPERPPQAAAAQQSYSYAEVTAAVEEKILLFQRLAHGLPEWADKGQCKWFAHGAIEVWKRLTYGKQAPGDAARLEALVNAIRPDID